MTPNDQMLVTKSVLIHSIPVPIPSPKVFPLTYIFGASTKGLNKTRIDHRNAPHKNQNPHPHPRLWSSRRHQQHIPMQDGHPTYDR